jgi:hypothetical protein
MVPVLGLVKADRPSRRWQLWPNRDQPVARPRPIGGSAATGQVDHGDSSKEVAMRPIRTITLLALGLVALAAAGCQRPSDPTATAAPTPTRVERAAPTTTPTRQDTAPTNPVPRPTSDPGPRASLACGRSRPWPRPGSSRTVLMPATSRGDCRPSRSQSPTPRPSWICSRPLRSGWVRPPTRSAPTTVSGRPPCTWPSPSATPTASGS